MPSYARKNLLTNSLIYHAFNRSNGGTAVFHTDNDYCHFVALLKNYNLKFALKIYHWVIMPNHFHLLFEIEEPRNISKFIAGLTRAYTHYSQKIHNTLGFLWQGRFKLQPVQKERYLVTCGRYIERNPLRANIVSEAHVYAYSSAQFYCGGLPDGITTTDPTYQDFGRDACERQREYKEFLRNFDNAEEKLFENVETPIGDKEFVSKLIKEGGRYVPRRKGRLKRNLIA